ncbi:MAG: hypothetical protein K2Z80_11025 [Xanthobacteraceae bacterium]|nr:hypothetical protein [Xanthobacteraceae bacterium]
MQVGLMLVRLMLVRLMPVRLGCCLIIAAAILAPHGVRAADCAAEVSKLMSKDTEKLTTRYQRVIKQIAQSKGSTAKLVLEECRIARQLKPRLEDQLAALKQSGCMKDPQMGNMIADIVRGHEDDLAAANRSTARSECR